jgi:hypothetical protein
MHDRMCGVLHGQSEQERVDLDGNLGRLLRSGGVLVVQTDLE